MDFGLGTTGRLGSACRLDRCIDTLRWAGSRRPRKRSRAQMGRLRRCLQRQQHKLKRTDTRKLFNEKNDRRKCFDRVHLTHAEPSEHLQAKEQNQPK